MKDLSDKEKEALRLGREYIKEILRLSEDPIMCLYADRLHDEFIQFCEQQSSEMHMFLHLTFDITLKNRIREFTEKSIEMMDGSKKSMQEVRWLTISN